MSDALEVDQQVFVTIDKVSPISIVEVGTQGPSGPAGANGATGPAGPVSSIVDTASYASPSLITTAISIPTDTRSRVFIKGSGGPVIDPTLGSGAAAKEMYLFGTDDTNTVQLDSTTNLQLSGSIVLKNGTMLCLHWITGLNKWVEAHRNEI